MPRIRVSGCALVVMTAGLLLAAPAAAEVHRFGVFSVSDEEPEIMLLDGYIRFESADDFRAALEAFPDVKVLDLHSQGGNVGGGLRIAEEVFARRIDTYVGDQNWCYSACSYVFFAGEERVAAGEIGVHQIVPNAETVTQIEFERATQGLVRALKTYLVPQQVIDDMLATPNGEMRVYSRWASEALGINRGEVVGALP